MLLKNKKILVIGYIPKQYGGGQTTGLATGIYCLHNAVNEQECDYKILIAGLDYHLRNKKIKNTEVFGWNMRKLIIYGISHPLKIMYFVFISLKCLKYRKVQTVSKLLVKLLFQDYLIDYLKPDCIHYHGANSVLLLNGLWDKKIKKIIRLHGINGYDDEIQDNQIWRKLESMINKYRYDYVTFVSMGCFREWEMQYGKINGKVQVVLNGVDNKVFYLAENHRDIKKEYDLITFSAISGRKGQERVIDALVILKEKGILLKYLIIGDGDERLVKKIKTTVDKYKLDVEFIPYLNQKEISYYIWRSKFFILPSTTEGFGKVYIESIACGTPIFIPKNIPLAKERGVLNAKNSIFMNGASTDDIANSLFNAFSSKVLYDPVIVASSVDNLRWENIAKRYIEVYSDVFG